MSTSHAQTMLDIVKDMGLEDDYFDSNGHVKSFFSKDNTKMKETMEKNPDKEFICFNMPARVTCPQAKVCLKYCYASKGRYVFPKNVRSMMRHYEISQTDRFVEWINEEVSWRIKQAAKKGKTLYVRVHDSGDYYSLEYARKWIAIANANPEATFYSYTKSVSIWHYLEDKGEKPDNFRLIMSEGGKEDLLIRDTDARAVVITSPEQMTDEMMDATGNDYVALIAKIVALPIH